MNLQQNIEATIADFNLNDMPAGRTAKRIVQLIKEDKSPQAAPEAVSECMNLLSCTWRYDSYNDQMVTGCKESWPGYKEVEMKFCFNCGKKIKHVSNVAT